MYSKDKLLPDKIIHDIPYKKTYQGLKEKDVEAIKNLFKVHLIRDQLQTFYHLKFPALQSNTEKKFALKAYIYLDLLVIFYRLPNHIEDSRETLT